ncbi:C-terminal binding protein [Pseudoroseicyclus tamaricis]|uniref:C-terminal binding protein n=2 Tax=Pseudoroseicyclus tamaricis TaxID=2705421 RepID=A0A6B2K2A0_9RHOB|nr:C-terminal binding protein [Pseudoroseicyclus tamaricis]NDV00556.1 C-terminal binding protein [Pseudoroseicyclus tamaricis]
MERILIIDPQFDNDPDVEREVTGPDTQFDIVREVTSPEQVDKLRRAHAVVNCRSRHHLPEAIIAKMDEARVVVQAGVGYDHIDLDACARRGIPVCNTPDYGTMEVADHAMALMLDLMRGTTAYNNRLLVRDDSWNTKSLPVAPVRRLSGQVLGIVGLGRIGMATSMRARAFGLEVIFYDPHLPAGAELGAGLGRVDDIGELFARSDIITLHCPLNESTRTLIDTDAIARLKPGAILINTARGGTMDLDAVEEGLRSGRLSGAGLDVLPEEPLDRSHPLLAAWTAGEPWLEGRLTITPHAAFFTPESLRDMRRLSVLAAIQFLREGRLRSCVNVEHLREHGRWDHRKGRVMQPRGAELDAPA